MIATFIGRDEKAFAGIGAVVGGALLAIAGTCPPCGPSRPIAAASPSAMRTSIEDHRDPWFAEADALSENVQPGDFEVAHASELPDDLIAHVEAVSLDPEFENELEEWLDHLLTADDLTLLLALEQSCDNGVLLPWDMRGVRLASLPAPTLSALHRLLEACPRHVMVHLAHYVYWLVRSERGRRRGSPVWSPSHPLPPVPWWQQEPPTFKPMSSWPRRWP